MTAQYHRDLRRRVERLEAHFDRGPEPLVYQCWKNHAGGIEIINGPLLCWSAKVE